MTARPASAAGAPPVVFLARNLVIGGAERAFLDYVNHARRVRPIVALLHREGRLRHELADGIPWHDLSAGGPRLPVPLPRTSATDLLREARRLAEVVRRTGAPLVSSFLMRCHIVALLARRLFVRRLRVVLNVHEHMTDSAPYLYPTRPDLTLMRFVTRRLFRGAARIVTVADAVRDDLVDRFGLPARRLAVIHNPLDLARIRASALEPAPFLDPRDRRPMIAAVGRLVPLKQYDLLLRAVAELRRTHDARLCLVGDGDERPALESLTRELGLDAAVTFAGWQRNPWAYVGRAAALALTSHTEAFPSVIGEALALGVPVLATREASGAREYLEEGPCGLLTAPEPAAVARGLSRLLDDRALRANLVERGRARVAAFDLGQVVARYEALLGDVLAGV